MLFYDKETGQIREGIQFQGNKKTEINLKTRYRVEVFKEALGVSKVNTFIFWNKPSDKDIIALLLEASNGCPSTAYFATVTEEKYLEY